MNCLNEALGVALPGNGTILATHQNRLRLFDKAAETIVAMTEAWYGRGDSSVLPRSVATREAFLNAMALDIAMGGSSNTVLHLLAVAREAGVDFTMKDIDQLSRKVPNLCKVAPSSSYHVEDVNRAGGIFAILGELERAGLLDTSVKRVDAPSLATALNAYDIMRKSACREAIENAHSAPGGAKRNLVLGSQSATYPELDRDRATGCIRDLSHAYNKDGGLAVLFGNLATAGCIVKTAGVDPSIYHFKGSARVYDSQEEACDGIRNGDVKAGDVVVIRYEGPKGGPGMQEMLYPTSYLKSKHLDKACALLTDGRFSGGTSGLSMGHVSPEAAAGGPIALLQTGDLIEIDIANRRIDALVPAAELEARRAQEMKRGKLAFKPKNRNRQISEALRAYAVFVSSADLGAVRRLPGE
jgi:dihydroxy-acid dehydratase